jgi:Lyase
MRQIWSDERKYQIWLEIEVLACEAMAALGQIPKEDAAEIRKNARFSIPEILEIEKRTNHDVIAFLENVASSVGPAARWIHQGLTSSDILDTTLSVQMTESIDILADDLKQVRNVIAGQARQADHFWFEDGADVRRIWSRRRTTGANAGACSGGQNQRRGRYPRACRSEGRARGLREAWPQTGHIINADRSA